MDGKVKAALILVVTGFILVLNGSTVHLTMSGQAPLSMGNPAAIYCTDLGYEARTIETENGQEGVCVFPDDSQCNAWDFLAGKCGQEYSYCAQQGYQVVTIERSNQFAPETAVCLDKNGFEVGAVTALSSLIEKSLHSCDGDSAQPVQPPAEPAKKIQELAGDPAPASFDWRDYLSGNWLSPVKNQSSCGSCWAFGVVGVTEAAWNIAGSNPELDLDLSEQYLVADCSDAGSCCGGWHDNALAFIRDGGIPDESCMPYADANCSCFGTGVCNCTYKVDGCSERVCSDRCTDYLNRLVTVSEFGYVGSDPANIKQALIDIGPLAVALRMSGSFDNEGIYRCEPDYPTNHVIAIVGYDDAGGYWIARNSWGASWNGDGYFKVGYGECSIEQYAYYAIAPQGIYISGYVLDNFGEPIEGAVMNGLPNTTVTTRQGYYVDTVPGGWSGTVTPVKDNHVFDPNGISFTNVTSAQTQQNFTGSFQPSGSVLLVDDDQNTPFDTSQYFKDSLDALDVAYDVWQTTSEGEPDANRMGYYNTIIWHNGAGDAYDATPSEAGEAALASWLDNGGCLLLNSQNYLVTRGRTGFIYNYLGVEDYDQDVGQMVVTGQAPNFSGLGSYSLSYPFTNLSDMITPTGPAALAFDGDQGNAAVSLNNGVFQTNYLAFPFEALPSTVERNAVLGSFLDSCGSSEGLAKSLPGDTSTRQSTSPALKWGDQGIVDSYEYCIDTNDNDTCDGSWVDAGAEKSAVLSELSPLTTYYWQVRSNAGPVTTYADGDTWHSFTTAENPDPCLNGLCIQVNDNLGAPLPFANVDIYQGSTLVHYKTMDITGYTNVILEPGTYTVVVTSTIGYFQVVRQVTAPGWEVFTPDGTVALMVSAKMLDDSPLAGAGISSTPSGFQGRILGYTDDYGEITVWVTPGTYDITAFGFADLYLLESGNQSISDAATINLHASSIPTGQINIDLVDFTEAELLLESPYPKVNETTLSLYGDSTVIVSAIEYAVELDLKKMQDTVSWVYTFDRGAVTMNSGSVLDWTAGGDFNISTSTDQGSYDPGNTIRITDLITDSYSNRLAGVSIDFGGVGEIVGDAGGGGGDYGIHPNLTVTDPDLEELINVRNSSLLWDTYSFALGGDAIPGQYLAELSLDTGPHMGAITAQDSFRVPAFTRLPADFDGDGDTDISVYRPSTGYWYAYGQTATWWGISSDHPVPGD
ncbi:MAG: DUF333 domain-containing protein, partial [Anaerolineales bacterium]|nr:DUF333 domain-containing protein [Anaerolineales bacterium]